MPFYCPFYPPLWRFWTRYGGRSADFAVAYLQPLFWLLTFQMIESAGIACLVGAGDTRTGLWVLGGVALLNVPLASGRSSTASGGLPGLGFRGIALGTAVSHLLGGLLVLTVLWRGRAGLRLELRLFRPRWDLWRRLLRVGVPAAADGLSVAVGQLWFLSIVNPLGDILAGRRTASQFSGRRSAICRGMRRSGTAAMEALLSARTSLPADRTKARARAPGPPSLWAAQ